MAVLESTKWLAGRARLRGRPRSLAEAFDLLIRAGVSGAVAVLVPRRGRPLMPLPASVALPPVAREALERLVARLGGRFGDHLLEIRLFGSRARGDARPGSDVDLLVVVRDEAPEDLEERVAEEPAARAGETRFASERLRGRR